MAQEPLTPAGVQQKQTDLYALSDNALQAEATAIRSNFIAWLYVNFIVNAAQLTYLNGMDGRWLQQAAAETAFAIENRLLITFTAPNPLPPPTVSKIVELDKKQIVKFSKAEGYTVEGSLEFKIIY